MMGVVERDVLSPRLRETVSLFAEGLSVVQIAERQQISPKGADANLERARSLLGFAHRQEMVVAYWRDRVNTPTTLEARRAALLACIDDIDAAKEAQEAFILLAYNRGKIDRSAALVALGLADLAELLALYDRYTARGVEIVANGRELENGGA